MSKFNKTDNQHAYRLLLVFILAFQGLISTGWILYENYKLWEADPSQNLMVSMSTAGLGLVFIVVAWWLLYSSEKKTAAKTPAHSPAAGTTTEKGQEAVPLRPVMAQLPQLLSTKEERLLPQLLEQVAQAFLQGFHLSGFAVWERSSDGEVLTNHGFYKKASAAILSPQPIPKAQHPYLFEHLAGISEPEALTVSANDWLGEILGEPFFQDEVTRAAYLQTLPVRGRDLLLFLGMPVGSPDWQAMNAAGLSLAPMLVTLLFQGQEEQASQDGLQERLAKSEGLFSHHAMPMAYFAFASEGDAMAQLTSEGWESLQQVQENAAYRKLFPKAQPPSLAELINTSPEYLGLLQADRPTQQPVTLKVAIPDQEVAPAFLVPHLQGGRLHGYWLSIVRTEGLYPAEEMAKMLLQQTEHILLTVNATGKVVYENLAARKALHIGADAQEALQLSDFFESTDKPVVAALLQQAITESRAMRADRLKLKINDEMVALCLKPSFDTGEPLVAVEVESISEAIAEDAQQAARAEFLDGLLSTGRSGCLVFDEHIMLHFSNGVLEQELNVGSLPEGLGFLHDKDRQLFAEKVYHVWETGKTLEMEFLLPVGSTGKSKAYRFFFERHPSQRQWVVLRTMVAEEASEERPYQLEMLTTILKGSTRMMLMLSLKGEILEANQRIAKVLQHTPKELEGESFLDLLHPKERPAMQSNLAYLSTNPHLPIHCNMYLLDGEKAWHKCDITGLAVLRDGEPIGYVLEVEEVTATHKADQLSAKARFLNTMLNLQPSPLLFMDYSGEIKYISDSLKQRLGYQLQGRLSKWLPSNQHATFEEKLAQVTTDPKIMAYFRASLMDKDGLWQRFDMQLINAQKSSSFKGVMAMLTPTEAEGEPPIVEGLPKGQMKLLELAVAGNPYVLLNMDLGGTMLEVSGYCDRIFGTPADSLVEKPFVNLVAPASANKLMHMLEHIAQYPKKPYFTVLKVENPQAGPLLVRAAFSMHPTSEGIQALLQQMETPAGQQAEEGSALHYAKALNTKLLKQLGSSLYHIKGSVSEIKEDVGKLPPSENGDIQQHWQELHQKVDRANKIAEEVASLTEEAHYEKELLNLNDILENSWAICAPEFYDATLFQCQLESDHWMHVPKLSVYELVTAILHFLAEVMPKAGTVQVELKKSDQIIDVRFLEDASAGEWNTADAMENLKGTKPWQQCEQMASQLQASLSLSYHEKGLVVLLSLLRNA